MAPQITYYVILPKQPPDVGGAIRPISKLLRTDEGAIRSMMLSGTFSVLQRFAKKANAEGLRNQMTALGVDGFIVSDNDLRGQLIIFAGNASKGQGGLAFRDFSDKPLYMPFEDLAAAESMTVDVEGDSTTRFIDLHRISTPIVIRLDTALFDFSELMGAKGATADDFLKELESRSGITVGTHFNTVRDHLIGEARKFATFPTTDNPPDSLLVSPYVGSTLRAANVYSFLTTVNRTREK